jgi:hypothetical protein
MANDAEIKIIELRRLAELEKQRAYHGIDTDPKILLEISDLRQKYGAAATAVSRDANPAQENRDPRTIRDLWNEVDFLRALISATLTRINGDAGNRRYHQRIYMGWMLLLTMLLLYALFIR